jgi:putative membrane protein
MIFFGLHLIAAVSWMVFLLLLIKSVQNNTADKFIFSIVSLFFMVLVLYFGVRLMLLNPNVAKSGGWLHVKLSFDILLMIFNVYLAYVVFRRKSISSKFLEISFWLTYLIFVFMLYLTMFRPF